MQVQYLSGEERDVYRDRLAAARDGILNTDQKSDLFDELAARFGHNSLAESLKDFGLVQAHQKQHVKHVNGE